MESAQSVSHWLLKLQDGDSIAAQKIWERYLDKLVRLANRKLSPAGKRVVDGEDIAQQAFMNFFTQFENGRFAQLEDRDDLWQVLVMLTHRRAIDQIKKENAQKAGPGLVKGESFLGNANDDSVLQGLNSIADADPSPGFAVQVAEQFSVRLKSLQDPVLERISMLKLEGYTNLEVSEKLDISLRGVERKLKHIRKLWQQTDE